MLFDRVYKLVVGQSGGAGKEITGLRIQFHVIKTTKKHPNRSTIKVWNLAPATRAMLEKPNTVVTLHAGYKEEGGAKLLFHGAVFFAWTKFEKGDVITDFELGDGIQEYRDTMISVGYDKKVESTTVLNDTAQKMGVALTMPSNAPTRTWENGLSYYGSARGLLDKVVSGTGLEWSIQNGNLQVLEKGGVTTRESVVLNAKSGMVGSPEHYRKSDAKAEKKGKAGKAGSGGLDPRVAQTSPVGPAPKTATVYQLPGPSQQARISTAGDTYGVAQTNPVGVGGEKKKKDAAAGKEKDGWKVTSLLIPTILPGDRVKLEGKDTAAQGIFRVDEVSHQGDSHTGDWQTEMKLVDPKTQVAGKASSHGGTASRGTAVNIPTPPIPPTTVPPVTPKIVILRGRRYV
jgi:hypothetical protein